MLPNWKKCSLTPETCPLHSETVSHGQDLPGVLTLLYRQARQALGPLELVSMKNILQAITHRDVNALPRGCRAPPSHNGYHRDPRLLVYVGVLTAPQHVGKRTILREVSACGL